MHYRIQLGFKGLAIVALFSLNLWAQREPAKVQPVVDSKYGSAAQIMMRGPDQLTAILRDHEASVFAKAKACQRLAIVGGREAVPALKALLSHETLSHYARFALEPIPDPAVDEALRDALGSVKGKLLVGVINSIGRRRDSKALDVLATLLHNADREVAEAAADAMARIRPPL